MLKPHVALFGPERSGLTNEDLRRSMPLCRSPSTPTSPAELAQAVNIVATYQLGATVPDVGGFIVVGACCGGLA